MENEKGPASGGAFRPFDTSLFSLPISLVALGLVTFIAAANRAVPLASLAAVALALMIAVRAWGRVSLLKLDLSFFCKETRLFPGDPVTLRADMISRKILPVWIRIELSHSAALTPEDSESARGETNLLPFERIAGSWVFRVARRGVYRLGPVALTAGDILGLYSREKAVPYTHEIVVFPRLANIPAFNIPFRDNFGIHPSKGIIEDPAWYEGTREYRGDKPAKNIHWKASARLTVLQEKIFAPTSHQKVFLVLDGEGFVEAQDEAGFETTLEILAALAARFSDTGASFALAANLMVCNYSAVIPLGRGPEHLGMVLELLARCRLEKGQALALLLRRAGAEGSGFVVASHSPTQEKTERFLALPSVRRNRAFFLFSKRAETDTPLDYPFLFFDDILQQDANV